MAIYSVKNSAIDFAVEEDFAFEPNMEGALAIVAESEENYNRIMKAIGISELNYFESTGTEMVYEAGKISSFLEKAKEFFIKLGKKIKAMFQKFIQFIESFTKNGEDFVKKYGAQLKGKDLAGFEFQGFKYTHLDGIENILLSVDKDNMKVAMDAMKNVNPEEIKGYKASEEESGAFAAIVKVFDDPDLEDMMRGNMLGEEKIEAGEFTEKLFAYFRNGESKRKSAATLGKADVEDALKHIKEAKKDIEAAKKAYKKIQSDLDKIINQFKNVESKLKKNADTEDGGKAVNILSKSIAILKKGMNLNVTAKGAYLGALRERNVQSRALCFKALSYRTDEQKEKEKLFGEGFTHFTEGFLDNVILK